MPGAGHTDPKREAPDADSAGEQRPAEDAGSVEKKLPAENPGSVEIIKCARFSARSFCPPAVGKLGAPTGEAEKNRMRRFVRRRKWNVSACELGRNPERQQSFCVI